MAQAKRPATGGRLAELDALRGVAALAVVLFHFTTRFEQLYPQTQRFDWTVDHGHFGVNLFFIISGYVIFMTLDRTRDAMDFVVSRCSRLYPAYWVSIVLTFCITHGLGLPGKLVSAGQALANGLMVHGLWRVPNVDAVYWTLEVELLFYAWMLLLFVAGWLDRVFLAVGALLVLRGLYWAAAQFAGVDLPFIVWRLLILDHLPWFALGLASHALLSPDPAGRRHRQAQWLAGGAVAVLLLTVSPARALLALALAGLVHGAASGRLPVLRVPVLVWLGAISYPLYLLHEFIGWSLMLQVFKFGGAPWLALLVALFSTFVLAQGVSMTVEKPAMHAIRSRWKNRRSRPAQA